MIPYDACVIHRGVKLHYTSDTYDYIKYAGKVTLRGSTFDKDPARWDYKNLLNKYQTKEALLDFFVINLYENPDVYVKNLLDTEAHNKYLEYLKNIESLEYQFRNDVISLLETYGGFGPHLFKGGNPPILDAAQTKVISRYTFIILDDLLNFTNTIKPDDTIIWPTHKKRLSKFSTFIKPRYKKQTLLRIIMEIVKL